MGASEFIFIIIIFFFQQQIDPLSSSHNEERSITDSFSQSPVENVHVLRFIFDTDPTFIIQNEL
ncbi:hypothetical protein T06_12531 [Trichinella sp. T6]|nr:hypothetical protein T06_12531 [Trichinella sp. T6]